MSEKITLSQLEREVEKIAEYIAQAKLEIVAISLSEEKTGTDKNLANAAIELQEVIRHTEEATNTIMDKADAVMQVAGGLSDADASGQLMDHAMGILEACSFQDITGQRIKKVHKTLEQIELRIGNLIRLFGGKLPENIAVGEVETGGPRRADEDLMNGPQLKNEAPTQDEIDKLFSS